METVSRRWPPHTTGRLAFRERQQCVGSLFVFVQQGWVPPRAHALPVAWGVAASREALPIYIQKPGTAAAPGSSPRVTIYCGTRMLVLLTSCVPGRGLILSPGILLRATLHSVPGLPVFLPVFFLHAKCCTVLELESGLAMGIDAVDCPLSHEGRDVVRRSRQGQI